MRDGRLPLVLLCYADLYEGKTLTVSFIALYDVRFKRGQKLFALNLGHRSRANEEANRQIKRKEATTAINNGPI